MRRIELVQLATLVIFAINTALVAGLIILKVGHRRWMSRLERRREQYVALLSRHLAFADCTDPITSNMAEDQAFLDALIDVRNAVAGPELATLRAIVDRHGVIDRQVRHLESSFPLNRRLQAAVALAEIGDETCATVLMDHLGDREPEIRIQCARGLARIHWTPAIDRIVWRFGEETPWVRARFSDTLTAFGSTATWPLIAYVRINHRFETTGPALAIRTLAQIEDSQAVAPLLGILERADDLEIKIATIEALGYLANPEAEPALKSALDATAWELRAKAATALGQIGDPSSIPALLPGLSDTKWWVRHNSAAAVACLPGGIDMLYQELENEDAIASDAAAEALTDAGELITDRPSNPTKRLRPELAHSGSEPGATP